MSADLKAPAERAAKLLRRGGSRTKQTVRA